MSIKNDRTQWKVPAMLGKQVLFCVLCVCVYVCVWVKQVALVEGDMWSLVLWNLLRQKIGSDYFTVASHVFIIQRNSRKTLLWHHAKCNKELA